MSGKRKKNMDLPPRVYLQRGTYFYVSRTTKKWIRLGTHKDAAIARGKELFDGTMPEPGGENIIDLSRFKPSGIKGIGALFKAARKLIKGAKAGAAPRGLAFDLSLQDVVDLLIAADGKCTATGITFTQTRNHSERIALWNPSLDRIDSKQGYVVGNVRVVCAAYNIAIQDHGDDVFRKLAIGFLETEKSASSNINFGMPKMECQTS